MKRVELVTVAMQGEFGTVTLLPITSTPIDAPIFRIPLAPDASNRLRKPSQIMIDKTITVSQERVSSPFGCVDARTMVQVERALALFFGLA